MKSYQQIMALRVIVSTDLDEFGHKFPGAYFSIGKS
jgi:hypothetical protein